MNRIAKTILTFLLKLATYHYFSPFLSSTKSFNKVYKGESHDIKNIIPHENESPPFSFENSFQIKDCSSLEHS